MSGFIHCLLSFCIIGYICYSPGAWHVEMPSNMKALLGSCLVIPCTYDYDQYPPHDPYRVVWYQYHDRSYPLVYDDLHPNKVIDKFRGRTFRVSISDAKQCSLQIYPVLWSDHRQKIYPWVDPENVGRSTYRFFDKTVTIEVVERAEKPEITFTGNMKVGETVTVMCTVYHTCCSNPPTLRLNIPTQRNEPTHSSTSDSTTKTTLTTTLNIKSDFQEVECTVSHTGGLTEQASRTLKADCSFFPLTIQPTSQEFLEGQASKFTCTAEYTCPKHLPKFTWSYGDTTGSTETKRIRDNLWRSVSTLILTTSANDNGKYLKCTAQFTGSSQRQEAGIYLQVKRNMLSRGWSFSTPGSITGMRGSCIIIPCSFTYSTDRPTGLRVIWYLYQSNGYPPVFDAGQSAVGEFRGMTSLIGSVDGGNCSLKIERLDMSHNKDRLYPWIDKNPITSYHTVGHTFYDKTTQLIVSDHAQEPQLSMTEIPTVGEQSQVSCSVRHTCITASPILTLSGITGTDRTVDRLVSDGIWERKVERIWTVKEEDQSVKCTVRFHGGQEATSELRLHVECPHETIKMVEQPEYATEGVAQSVVCSVSYKCKKNTPTIMWNYKDMQSLFDYKMISSDTYRAVSNLTFIGSLEDDGKSLTCTAKFYSGETSDSATIHVKPYERQVEEIDPHENDTFHVLAADVPFRITALTRSCVVIPCTFKYPEHVPLTRGIWSKKTGGVIFHRGQSRVLDHFKGRTKILGGLTEGNCTLEIDNIKSFDNGPFCFHAERGNDKYRFNNSCAFVVMKASPAAPVMTPVPAEVDAGSTITVSCSVTHTCSSQPPEFSWSVSNLTSKVTDTSTEQGIWERTSTITFMVTGRDGVHSLTCTATFWRGKQQASSVELTVKGSLMYQFRSSVPVTMPVSALVLIVIILAAVFGVVICRKRKRSDDSLRPPQPEKRRLIWNRFSRHQDNTVNLSVGYLRDTENLQASLPISEGKQETSPPCQA